ncbi:hypothetical protein LZG00_01485 [Rhodobacteraceae bacterium LMO-12]|nr:hypothetical protein [Rhodobacteraceae bacterium LMO-JJ12]
MTATLLFDPLLPWPVIGALLVLALAATGFALWRGLSGWALRALAALLVLCALTGPVWQQEERDALPDIAIMVVDQSISQKLSDRTVRTEEAAAQIAARINAMPNTRLHRINITDGPEDTGTLAMAALSNVLAEQPHARISGLFLISDGRIHDIDNAPELPAPLHLLLTGDPDDWDRRIVVENAPAYAILGEEITLTLRIEDQGQVPNDMGFTALEIAVDGGEPMVFQVPVGQSIELPVSLPHGGRNVLQFTVPTEDGELTGRNNTSLVQINGVRDRLRVLLVSGEPHPGGRTWRNLLKSDSSVDLVHFTILRPPEKQDGVPVGELSLIAFPTRELFLEKIEDFDLIIFDRYKRRGILPSVYLENVRSYAEKGGAVLIAAGPDFASADSIYRSPLAQIVPASPTARVIDQGYRPEVTELGQRHPVTADLTPADGLENWGRWMRQIEVVAEAGDVVMSGIEGNPLLILDRVGEGRVALLASDHAWLWSRGFEGGGPQLELLRRLAHWMMKEPDLEEEALWAEPNGQSMRIIRRTLSENAGTVTVTPPSGEQTDLPLAETEPGRFEVGFDGEEVGLYRLTNGDLSAVVGLGPSAPREFIETVADAAILTPLIATKRGGVQVLSDGIPNLRHVRPGRPAAGNGWLGLTPRNAYRTVGVAQVRLLPEWLVLALVAGFILLAWLREGRR